MSKKMLTQLYPRLHILRSEHVTLRTGILHLQHRKRHPLLFRHQFHSYHDVASALFYITDHRLNWHGGHAELTIKRKSVQIPSADLLTG